MASKRERRTAREGGKGGEQCEDKGGASRRDKAREGEEGSRKEKKTTFKRKSMNKIAFHIF